MKQYWHPQNKYNRTILTRISNKILGFFIGIVAASSICQTHAQTEEVAHFNTYKKQILPIMEQYCYDCHMDGSDEGSLDLDKYTSFISMTEDRESWHKIKEHLELKLMPPVDEVQPTEFETKKMVDWIDNTIFYVDPNKPDPGKVVLRRLNRNEYQNTIQDLLGVKIDVENLLPLDDTGYGFDTISDVHTISPAHVEKYLTAAETALNQATHIGIMPWETTNFRLEKLNYYPKTINDGFFFVNGTTTLPTKQLKNGIYELEVTASSDPAGDEEAILQIKLGNKVIAKQEVPHNQYRTITTVKLSLNKESPVSLSFINDLWDPEHPRRGKRDRNLKLHSVKLTGPLDGKRPEKPITHFNLLPKKTVSQSNQDYALECWHKLANKAFRRPVTLNEVRPYLEFLSKDEMSEEILQRKILSGMQAILCSPEFLYINSSPSKSELDVSPLTELALASRLSYFLWSSTPDETLLKKASNNQLRTNLTDEINRMLNDPKSENFIKNFSGQWLQLRDLEVNSPDSKLFPRWNDQLKKDAVSETHHFLKHLLSKEASLLDCLDSNYSFLNARLAKFYGVKGITGDHFRKVTFPDNLENGDRGGLLTQLSVLTVTSYPDRTSPVLRGKWILENILGTAPPPPPGDIPSLEPDAKQNRNVSLRKQLEAHRKKAECAACHNLLDPLGFTMENYNAIGEWRLTDNGNPIDSFGRLITGETFNNGEEMKTILRNNKADDFLHCLSEKLLTYSLGRGLEYYDKYVLRDIINETKKKNLTLRSLIHAVCNSIPFQMTRTN